MTFGFIFTRTLDAQNETCYRLTIPDKTHVSRIKTLKHHFKNNMDPLIEVSDKSFLDTPDSLIHTIGPVGQFVTSEAEVLLDILHKNSTIFVSYSENRSNRMSSTSVARAKFNKKKLVFNNIFIVFFYSYLIISQVNLFHICIMGCQFWPVSMKAMTFLILLILRVWVVHFLASMLKGSLQQFWKWWMIPNT